MFLLHMRNNHSVCVLDEHAIEMSSKSGLRYLTAAYRVKVLLFICLSYSPKRLLYLVFIVLY